MNLKILKQLEDMFKTSPQILRDQYKLRQSIQGIFNVWVDDVSFNHIGELVDKVDDKVLEQYFSRVWQPELKKYKYSGPALIDEVNKLNPKNVLDVGCGYNEFRGNIHNLTGLDPYNPKADVMQGIMDYDPDVTYDVVLCLGSINFGDTNKILNELEHVVNLTSPDGKIFFRVNPGLMHDPMEADWIQFYAWTPTFIINTADFLGVTVLDLRTDGKNRMYFVWAK